MRLMTSEEYLAVLERKLSRLKGSKNPSAHDLIESIDGMKSHILYDVLMNAENIQISEIPSQDTDPLLHSDLLDEIHSTFSEWSPSVNLYFAFEYEKRPKN